MSNKAKILVILGPTASGKSALAMKIAKKFNGEIISADSRQIYRGMDIGSGRITKKEAKGIKHHLLDIAMPNRVITVSQWQKMANQAIKRTLANHKLPIICGGTGLYISALVNNAVFPSVKPNWKLRKKLSAYSPKKLFSMLKKLDERRAKNIDQNNPARLIRAIEIARKLGSVPRNNPEYSGQNYELRIPSYDFLQIGIEIPREELYKKINKRVDQMVKKGLFQEAKKLLKKYPTTLPSMSGIGYQEIEKFFKKEISKKETIEQIKNNTRHYAKRQMTWFSAQGRSASGGQLIKWVKNYREAEKLVKNFLK